MLIDGRSIPPGTELTTDVCIIGAGAVGITMALSLINAPFSVAILESGGLEPEADSQDLARGQVSGLPYFPLEAARMRCFGGSTQHWGGWCRPLDPIDFETREWIAGSGWPITRADLDSYYVRAQELCQLGEFDYETSGWQLDRSPPLALSGERLKTRLIQFSPPARFGVRYRDAVLRAANVTTYLHSNAIELEPHRDVRKLERLHVKTLTGNAFTMRARIFVLATGGIDNPRLLLASNRIATRGLGNDADLVGRYFADHMQLDTAGVFPLDSKYTFDLYQGGSREILRRSTHPQGRPASLMGYLTLTPDVQRARRTLNYSANLFEAYWSDYFLHANQPDQEQQSLLGRSADAIETLWDNLADAVSQMFRDRRPEQEQRFYKIVTTQEQAPNPDSRVTLGTEKDPLGMPRARLTWQLTDLDRHTLQTGLAEIVQAFGSAGIARLNVPNDLSKGDWPSYMTGSWHHCGTTRMHADPRRGVVDPDGRVHGIANLYVAGSSVFPTPGNGNPTLTIVALAMRLADHLKGIMHA